MLFFLILFCSTITVAQQPELDNTGRQGAQIHNMPPVADAQIGDLILSKDLVGIISATQPGKVNAVAFSPDGNLVCVAGEELIGVWEIETAQQIYQHATSWGVGLPIAFSPNSLRLAIRSDRNNVVTIHNAHTGIKQLTLEAKVGVHSLAFSPNSEFLATGHSSTTVLWELNTGTQVRGFPNKLIVRKAPEPDFSDQVEVGRKIREIIASSTRPIPGASFVRSIDFSPDGSLFAASYEETRGKDKVIIWDVVSGKMLTTLDIYKTGVNTIDFSPDGKLLATGSSDNMIALWDTKSWKLSKTLSKRRPSESARYGGRHYWKIQSVRFSPDGKQIASAHYDNKTNVLVRLWNIDSQEEITTFNGSINKEEYVAHSLDYSPGGRFLLVGGSNFVLFLEIADSELWLPNERKAKIEAEKKAAIIAPFFNAINKGEISKVKNLLATGIDPNTKDDIGLTPLWIASGKGNGKIAEVLLNAGADVKGTSLGNATALWFASQKGHLHIVKLLIAHDADVNAMDELGGTALQWAAYFGHIEVVKLLLSHNASVNASRKSGQTALSMALSNGHKDIAQVLQAAGAYREVPEKKKGSNSN
jgi:WD40 repeat protein